MSYVGTMRRCDHCGDTQTVTPKEWHRLRVVQGGDDNTRKLDACSPECSAQLVHMHSTAAGCDVVLILNPPRSDAHSR